MANYPQGVLNWILDIIFPKKCFGCAKFTADADFDYVCRKCFGEIPLKSGSECIGCKKKTKFGLTCMFCERDNYVDQLIIAAELSDLLVDKMLKAYKYKFIKNMSKPLSAIAQKGIKKLLRKGFNLFEDNPLIVPIPLHVNRLNWRGFNQSQLLADLLSDNFLVSSDGKALARTAWFKNQADIKAREDRMNNVKNNFAVKNDKLTRGKTIILVDDICTTGATLNECARVLKENGSKKIIGFVIARGQFKIPNF